MSPGDIAQGVGGILSTPYAVDFDKLNSIGIVVENIFGVILGFAAVFIIVFMTVLTTLDVLYLTIPLFREYIQRKNWDGSSDTKQFKLISSDARHAVEEMSIGEGKPPIAMYCWKRLKTYVLCTVIFLIITVYQDQLIQGVRAIVLKALAGAGIV